MVGGALLTQTRVVVPVYTFGRYVGCSMKRNIRLKTRTSLFMNTQKPRKPWVDQLSQRRPQRSSTGTVSTCSRGRSVS